MSRRVVGMMKSLRFALGFQDGFRIFWFFRMVLGCFLNVILYFFGFWDGLRLFFKVLGFVGWFSRICLPEA